MQTPTVETNSGTVIGHQTPNSRRWLGIPYAKPPVGALRWQPPQAHASWSRPLVAAHFSSPAVQHASPMGQQIPGGFDHSNEDCLTLNVFAPAVQSEAPLPVMVWLHGGGFAAGSAAQRMYHGDTLANDGNVIVVTVNYRLGVLGFVRLTDITRGVIPATGNEGLLDQIAALEWLRDNVAAFGGDANNITLFGESAGAMSVASLCAIPRATALFHRAIMQSGSAHAAHDIEQANKVAELFLRQLPAAAAGNPMRADRASLIHAAQQLHGRMMFDERLTIMPTRPVIDNTYLTKLPIDALRESPPVALLIGTNRDEWRYFAQVDRGLRRLDHDGLIKRLRYHYDDTQIDALLAAYRYQAKTPDAAFKTFCAIAGDAAFRVSSDRAGTAVAPTHDVFRYRFDEPAPGIGGQLGACHVAEIPFVFGTLDAPGSGVLFSNNSSTQALSQRMRAIWCQFAHDGSIAVDDWPTADTIDGEYRLSTQAQGFHHHERHAIDQFWSTISDGFLQTV